MTLQSSGPNWWKAIVLAVLGVGKVTVSRPGGPHSWGTVLLPAPPLPLRSKGKRGKLRERRRTIMWGR